MLQAARAELFGSLSLPARPASVSTDADNYSLSALQRRCSEILAGFKDLSFPVHPLSDREAGGLYAARSVQKSIHSGAHEAAAAAAHSSGRAWLPRAITSRLKLAADAVKATGGGKLAGALTRIGGRLAAPVLFAMDVMSEEDRARGFAKATGGFAAAGLGWHLGSALGAGLGTVLLPGIGTTAGYFIGGAAASLLGYGWGKKTADAAYDWMKSKHPEALEQGKGLVSDVIKAAKDVCAQGFQYLQSRLPGWLSALKASMQAAG